LTGGAADGGRHPVMQADAKGWGTAAYCRHALLPCASAGRGTQKKGPMRALASRDPLPPPLRHRSPRSNSTHLLRTRASSERGRATNWGFTAVAALGSSVCVRVSSKTKRIESKVAAHAEFRQIPS
jgi:hypothetical protein